MKRILIALAAVTAVALAAGPLAARQSDVTIAQRQPAVCAPLSTTPNLYYNLATGSWRCTASRLTVLVGGSTTTPAGGSVGALTDATSTTSGTVQSTEYTLNSITLPANAFNVTGRAVEVSAWGTTAANANAKNVKIYFGSTAVATVTGSTASAKDFLVALRVVRTGASTQSGVGSIMIDTGTSATMAVNAALAQTDTGPIVIAVKSANTAAAAASATGKGLVATFLN